MTPNIRSTAATEQSLHSARNDTRSRRLRRLSAVVAAALLAIAIWAIAVPVAGIDLIVGVGESARRVDLASVAIAPVGLGLAAWALLALLERLSPRGRRIWQVIGWVVLALSLVGPLSMGGAPGVLATLLAMHVVVGVTVILGLAHPRQDA